MSLKQPKFCNYLIKDLKEGDLDEIYCYINVSNIKEFMSNLFKMSYKPSWITIQKRFDKNRKRVSTEADFEVRICYQVPHKMTLRLNFEQRKKFVIQFENNIKNSFLNEYNCEFQLFYKDNINDKKAEETSVITDASLSVVSSIGREHLDFHYYGLSGYSLMTVNEENYLSILDRIDKLDK